MTQDSAALAATSFADYLRESIKRIRGGESGVLPVLVGLVVIGAIFQIQQPVFLSAGNLTNLLIQGATFVLLGMAEVFVLLLGEIDLSIGYVAGVGAVVTVALSAPPRNQSWWVSVLAGLAVTTLIGLLQGLIITRLRLPSFVVTLAGLIGWEGVLIFLVDRAAGDGELHVDGVLARADELGLGDDQRHPGGEDGPVQDDRRREGRVRPRVGRHDAS